MPTVTLTKRKGAPDSDGEDGPDSSIYLPTWRPWLALYGARIRRGHQKEEALSPIQALLPDELMVLVFEALPMHSLAAVCCVCSQWRRIADTPSLWRRACMTAFSNTSPEANAHIMKTQHKGKWRNMFLDRPHLRFDGLYVSRNTYIKRGIVEWRVRNACHVVCYYRYCRFFPDGRLLYRTSPEVVSKVAKSMTDHAGRRKREEGVSAGSYFLDGEKLFTKVRYDNARTSEVRTRLRVRGTCRGAWNRLDVLAITSFDFSMGVSTPMTSVSPEEDEEEGEERQHKRGMSPYVFVPWEEVHSSILNLGVDQMDVWVPG